MKRLSGLLDNCGEIVIGGDCDPSDNYVAPTIVNKVKLDSELMKDEIFGPILPIIPYDSVNDAVKCKF